MPGPVSEISITTSSALISAGAKGNGAGRRRVLVGVREQADQHLAQQHRVGAGGEIGLDFEARSRRPRAPGRHLPPPSRPWRRRRPPPRPRRSPPSGRASAATCQPASRARRRAARRSRKWSRASGSSLAPVRSTSIAPDMPAIGLRSSWAALETNSRSASSLAQLLGAVADDGQDGVLGGQLARRHRVDALLDRQLVLGRHAALAGALQAGAQRRRRAPVLVDQRCGGRVGEADVAGLTGDDHHGFVERVEDRREPVALGGKRVEGLCAAPHAFARGRGRGRRSRRAREASSGTSSRPSAIRPRAFGQPLDSAGDQAGDEETDHQRRPRPRSARLRAGRRAARPASAPGTPAGSRGQGRPRAAGPKRGRPRCSHLRSLRGSGQPRS